MNGRGDGGLGFGRFGTEGEEEEDGRAGDEQAVGDVEDGELEVDGVDVEEDEVSDEAEAEAVVAVAERAGHDESEGEGLLEVGEVAGDEEPVDDEESGGDGEDGEEEAAAVEAAAEAPEGAWVVARAKLKDWGDEGEGSGLRWADVFEDEVFGGEVGPRAGEGQEPEEDGVSEGEGPSSIHRLLGLRRRQGTRERKVRGSVPYQIGAKRLTRFEGAGAVDAVAGVGDGL